MEFPMLAFTIFGIVFICSFIVLIVLYRYKSIRRNATRYVKKLARSDLRHKEIEMVEKRAGLVKRFLKQSGSNGALLERCQQLLDLCNGMDLTSRSKLTQPDIQKIYAIVQMAQSITEEADDWAYLEGREKAGLLEKKTAGLLQQVSSAMAAMEARLGVLKETSVEDSKTACSYQNSLII